MSTILQSPLTGPAAWRGEDLAGDTSWIHHLSPAAIAAIDAALAHLKSQGLHFPDFTQADFPLPEAFRAELKQHADALENGVGFVLLRGLPIERYSDEEINAICTWASLCARTPVVICWAW